jgi:hypothetical protein
VKYDGRREMSQEEDEEEHVKMVGREENGTALITAHAMMLVCSYRSGWATDDSPASG